MKKYTYDFTINFNHEIHRFQIYSDHELSTEEQNKILENKIKNLTYSKECILSCIETWNENSNIYKYNEC